MNVPGPADVAAYDYELPDALIAREPAARRELARLLVVETGRELRDATFAAFPELLRAGDVLVLNETRVIPARLAGTLAGGGRAEALLLLAAYLAAALPLCPIAAGAALRQE